VLALLEEMLNDPASGVAPPACILVEPIQGNGGVVIPPPGFLAGLRQLASASGALLIFDEIQCGFGRTGRWWACEHEGVTPDLLTIGKGIGGGLPIAAVVGSVEAMSVLPPDAVTSTFLANALSQAAAIATVDVMHEEGLVERSATLGRSALSRLDVALSGHPAVGAVRGRGLFVGIEIVSGTDPDPAGAEAVVGRLRDRNIIAGRGGRFDNVVKLSPPLNIPEPELALALEQIVEVIA